MQWPQGWEGTKATVTLFPLAAGLSQLTRRHPWAPASAHRRACRRSRGVQKPRSSGCYSENPIPAHCPCQGFSLPGWTGRCGKPATLLPVLNSVSRHSPHDGFKNSALYLESMFYLKSSFIVLLINPHNIPGETGIIIFRFKETEVQKETPISLCRTIRNGRARPAAHPAHSASDDKQALTPGAVTLFTITSRML